VKKSEKKLLAINPQGLPAYELLAVLTGSYKTVTLSQALI